MEEIWNQVLAELQIEVSQPRFIAFFKSTKLIKLEGDIATIGTPNPMTADLLEKNYYSLIKSVLDKKTDKENSIVFTIQRIEEAPKTEAGPLFNVTQPTASRKRPNRIREDYNFDNFAVSDSNQLAYTAAYTVATDPGGKYNPLFLYGTVGVGKTHLMNAIANSVFEGRENATIEYLTTEEFTNEMVEAIQTKSTNRLRKKFRNIDLLLLDDIQFLSGKDKVQEELFHTFNTLIDNHGQVVFSSDRPPYEIKKIEARLASRFESGLTIDIAPPDPELRSAILLIKSKKHGINLTTDLAQLVAEKILDSRALEGFLLKLSTLMTMRGASLATADLIEESLGSKPDKKPSIHADDVIRVVCDFYGIKPTQLRGSRRDASLVKPRQICMFLLKEDIRITHVEIGNLLGGRDHTTVMHGVSKIANQITKIESLSQELGEIRKILSEEI